MSSPSVMASPTEARADEETLPQDPVPSESTAEGIISEHPVTSPVCEERAAVAQDPAPIGGPSGAPDGKDPEESLALADELHEKGSKAIEDGDYADAVDCLSRALEIRVSQYGELAQECANSYYKYGCALLYKAQEEADPLGNFPKVPPTNEDKSETSNFIKEGSSSKASADDSSNTSLIEDGAPEGEDSNKDSAYDEVDNGSEVEEDTAEADDDESDLDLAWKMLDIARAIVEKHPEETMEKVNILAALAEVSMEREDTETSLGDYLKALSIVEHLVEPDHRRIVELISLVLELASRIDDAIPYCQKAISLCKSRLLRLKEGKGNLTTPTVASGVSGVEKIGSSPAEEAKSSSNVAEEIELLSGILTELEKKLEDLQQITANPRSIISEVMKLLAPKRTAAEKDASAPKPVPLNSSVNGGFDSPTISSTATNGVMDLGVVGRGIKRATVQLCSAEPSHKKPTMGKHTGEVDHSNNSTDQEAVTLGSNPKDA